MTKKYEAGSILNGKVTGIQPYGAFVALDDETQGLVHISEIKHGFVKDINDTLTVGDEVKVKVLNTDEATGKISLSIKATLEEPVKEKAGKPRRQGTLKAIKETEGEGFNTLKDKLEEWIEKSKDSYIQK